jgi:hypothetical protein
MGWVVQDKGARVAGGGVGEVVARTSGVSE